MKNKIKVICILAATIIILSGFTTVLGVQTTDTKEKNESPLFDLRTKRLVDNINSDSATFEYIGKGKTSNVLHILKSNRMDSSDAVYRLKSMNDAEFDKFVNLVIIKLLEEKHIDKKDIPEAVNSLNYIRENPELLKEDGLITSYLCTIKRTCPTGGNNPNPLCRIMLVIYLIFVAFPLLTIYIIASVLGLCH